MWYYFRSTGTDSTKFIINFTKNSQNNSCYIKAYNKNIIIVSISFITKSLVTLYQVTLITILFTDYKTNIQGIWRA